MAWSPSLRHSFFSAHPFRQIIRGRSMPDKFIHYESVLSRISRFPPDTPKLLPSHTHTHTYSVACIARQSRWNHGYWDRSDIQSSAPQQTVTHINDRFWDGAVVNDQLHVMHRSTNCRTI
ncbi:hypothetical protein AVEN_142112-1 [Araneus ventricosus]|uniref:Uncharacterized protein n=1 Tax=Araneus ventricosus TaxID=182803 RepID=A0A4Y2W1U7_ARAVE|nr:hypothetical protein AVEN_142112-1 [Araneus ventricosus]